MLFNSVEFLLFLPLVLILYYLVQHKYRVILLLLASYYFYLSWNPVYIVLIILSTFTDYSAGLLLGKQENPGPRKLILTGSFLVNLGLLVYFKYSNFILENIDLLAAWRNPEHEPIKLLDIILPVGISFYTFQTLSYTIDVYFRKIQPERNPLTFALYVCFFPQLVAGPIERFSALTPQFQKRILPTRENFSRGARLILYGFFLKMVIADNLSGIIDATYEGLPHAHSLNLVLVAVFYSFQIYCDFHGYSSIAIGVAQWFGIELSPNFKTPYFAVSLTEFWRKWHITLTSWFRDYIYYPMGGNRSTRLKWVAATLIVFVVSGIWHGSKWTFFIWGLLHGVFILLEKLLKLDKKSRFQLLNVLHTGFTFALVTLLWVFFRSPDFGVAKAFFKGLYANWNLDFVLPGPEPLLLVALFLGLDFITRKNDFAHQLGKASLLPRWSLYFLLIFLILARGGTDMQPFIYFQF
ncbi:MAG: MBOAT family protein [Bacteroidia bacterium]|nr:MBOAT family protein [Bacteroidia bacterium]